MKLEPIESKPKDSKNILSVITNGSKFYWKKLRSYTWHDWWKVSLITLGALLTSMFVFLGDEYSTGMAAPFLLNWFFFFGTIIRFFFSDRIPKFRRYENIVFYTFGGTTLFGILILGDPLDIRFAGIIATTAWLVEAYFSREYIKKNGESIMKITNKFISICAYFVKPDYMLELVDNPEKEVTPDELLANLKKVDQNNEEKKS